MDKNVKLVLGVLAAAYLLNLTGGFIEFLPDNLPMLGNIDEGVAAIIAYNTLIKKQNKLV